MSVTLAQLIDRARTRHGAFTDVQMPEGAAVQFINERQRALLLLVIGAAEALIGQSAEVQTDGTATLVALDASGAPYFTTTTEDGYAIKFSGGVPYVDLGQLFVSDPFGESGNVPGFPLPATLLRLIAVQAMTTESTIIPKKVEILEQRVSATGAGKVPRLSAFINGARLVPFRTADTDDWSRVTSLRLAYVLAPDVAALADTLTIPDPLLNALTAHVVEFFATASRTCPEPDKQRFERQRKEADALLEDTADNILSSVMGNSIVFRG